MCLFLRNVSGRFSRHSHEEVQAFYVRFRTAVTYLHDVHKSLHRGQHFDQISHSINSSGFLVNTTFVSNTDSK